MHKLVYAGVLVTAVGAPSLAHAQQRGAPAALTISVQVTDRSGNPLAEVAVAAAGPVERSGSTGADGRIAFRSMRPGTYRLRFEHERFVTLEREFAMRGQPADVSVALTAAPPKPEPPEPTPAPAPPTPAPPARVVEPRAFSLIDWVEKNLIGSEPSKRSMLACTDGGTATLLQVRDPLTDQQHADADEIIYVIAGAGVVRMKNQDTKLTPGSFALLPRGVPHTLRRDGRNPLIALSVMAGTPCTDTAPPVR
jgi:mannose-6-phosphate isomerase-like protein (cupin superfamily)